MYIHRHIDMYSYCFMAWHSIYNYICIRGHMHVYICVYIYICIYLFIYTHMCVYTICKSTNDLDVKE